MRCTIAAVAAVLAAACNNESSPADGGAIADVHDVGPPDAGFMDAADPCEDAACMGLGVCSRELGGRCVLPEMGKVGEPCAEATECAAGEQCFTEEGQGFPGGYCSNVPCNEFSPCPANAVCVSGGPGAPTSYCLKSCSADQECRERYVCDPTPSPDGPTACVPACPSDLGCAIDGSMTCSSTTGRCIENLMHADTASVGDPCAGSKDCALGQACIEAWPDGYCIEPCAGLSCPDGAICVETALGNLCFDRCSVRADCRDDNYACDVVTQRGFRACVPSCTADPCPEGATCNTTSGLCQ
jgi:hypothetical protein